MAEIDWQARAEAAERQVAALRDALAFYGTESGWVLFQTDNECHYEPSRMLYGDAGARAEAVLEDTAATAEAYEARIRRKVLEALVDYAQEKRQALESAGLWRDAETADNVSHLVLQYIEQLAALAAEDYSLPIDAVRAGVEWYAQCLARNCGPVSTCTFHVHESASDSVTSTKQSNKEVVPGAGVELPPVIENT